MRPSSSRRTRRARSRSGSATVTSPGPGSCPTQTSCSPSSAPSASGSGASAGSSRARLRKLRQRRAHDAQRPRVRLAAGRQHRPAPAPRQHQQLLSARDQALAEPRRIARERGQLVDLAEAKARPPLPDRVGAGGVLDARPAQRALQHVGELGLVEASRDAQPRQQILGRPAGQHHGEQRDQRAAERGVRDRDAALERDRHAGLGEHALDERRRVADVAQRDRDLLGRRALGDRRARGLGDQLQLGPLPAAHEQGHRDARVRALRRVGEQRALEMPERGDALLAVGQAHVPVARELEQLAERARARAVDVVAPVLVGQRDDDLGADRRQGADRVELRRGEVVEAVEEHGRGVPRVGREPQRVVQLEVTRRRVTADACHAVAVGAVERGELLRVRGALGLRLAPGAQRRVPEARTDPRLGELVAEPGERRREARGLGRRDERLQPCRADRRLGDAPADDRRAPRLPRRRRAWRSPAAAP